jgi:histone H3/H4
MKEKSFKVYIIRLLKAVSPGIRITRSATETIDSILRVIATKIVDRSETLTINDNKKTISDRELLTSVKTVITDSVVADFASNTLSAFLQSEGDRSRSRAQSRTQSTSDGAPASQPPREKAQTRESRCGLIFSVSAGEKYIRRFDTSGFNMSAGAPVVLTAVLEQLARMFLLSATEVCKNSDKITINNRHLYLALTENGMLDFIRSFGIVFLEGGVVPQVIKTKQHSRRRSSRVKVNESENNEPEDNKPKTRPHRWRPGTKTVMEIRRLQVSGDLLMQHAPFNNLVRELVNRGRGDEKFRLTADFCRNLQAFFENKLTELMVNANKIALHSGRETVYARDIELARTLSGELEQEIVPHETHIPEASLRQLALRAGIRRFGDCSTDAYRNYIVQTLDVYLRNIVMCADHHGLQTLNSKLLLETMEMFNLYPSATAKKRRGGRAKGARSKSEVASEVASDVAEKNQEQPELSDVEADTAN